MVIAAEGEYGAQGISPCRINAAQTYRSDDRCWTLTFREPEIRESVSKKYKK
jgi:hypothetical protein